MTQHYHTPISRPRRHSISGVHRRRASTSTLGRVGNAILHGAATYGQSGNPFRAAASVAGSFASNPSRSIPTAVGDDTAQTTRGVTVLKHRNKKIHKYDHAKKVKVSKAFCQKVEKALEKEGLKAHGSFRQFSVSGFIVNTTNFNNGTQYVFVPGAKNTSNFFNTDAWGACGNVSQYIHMLSVLWNKKADSQTNRSIVSSGSLGIPAGSSTYGAVSDAQKGRAETLQFTVKNHYEVYRFKNNSERTIKMKAYLCSPKAPTSEDGSALIDTTGTISIQPGIADPYSTWVNGLNTLNDQGVFPTPMNPQQLYQSPLACPQFKKYWNAEETTFVVEPGQTFEYKVQGPKMLNVNSADCWASTLWMDIQKWAKFPMFVAHLDLIHGAVSGVASRVGNSNDLQVMSCEREIKVSFVCPEQVGFTAIRSVIGAPVTETISLNQRMNKAFYAYYAVGLSGEKLRIDEEVPGVAEAL